VQDVLALIGAVEDEVLFRLCDLIVDGDTAGALVFLEELSERGQDLGRLVTDLLEHLRHLMLVQHMGEVPDTLPVTDEARERLREQANQLGPATVVRLIDLLHVAVDDLRQGGDPRLPLELALVKVTRASSDLSGESLAYRVERLESGATPRAATAAPVEASRPAEPARDPEVVAAEPEPEAKTEEPVAPEPERREEPKLALEQLQEAWRRSVLPAVEQRGPGGMPAAAMLTEAHPAALEGDSLTLEFPPEASFHRERAEDPKNVALLTEALYEVTGRRLEVVFALGERKAQEPEPEHPTTEEGFVALMKSEFDAQEL
jgi:DNA polymerase-3 subunit gamma/tau